MVTEDGYILTLFRIPNDPSKNVKVKKEPLFLMHGIVSTSATFLGLGKDSLGKCYLHLIYKKNKHP